jgi:hypothetical protein
LDSSVASWLVVLLAIASANLPFLSERLFALIPAPSQSTPPVKSLWWRLLELIVLYLAVGGIGMLIEGRMGNIFPQTWEFYAISAVIFLVLAYPGFAYRYLRKRRS